MGLADDCARSSPQLLACCLHIRGGELLAPNLYEQSGGGRVLAQLGPASAGERQHLRNAQRVPRLCSLEQPQLCTTLMAGSRLTAALVLAANDRSSTHL